MRIKQTIRIILFLFLVFDRIQPVYAMTEEELIREKIQEQIMSQGEARELDEMMEELFPAEKMSFQELVEEILKNDDTKWTEKLFELGKEQCIASLNSNRNRIIQILILTLAASGFLGISDLFRSKQVASTTYYILYILVMTVVLKAFQVAAGSVKMQVELLVRFMEVFCPLYLICMTLAIGSLSSVAFYQIIILAIYFVEWIILNGILPMVHLFVVIKILNELNDKDHFSKLADLIQFFIHGSLKILIGIISGMSLVKGILTPALDQVKGNLLLKNAELIPGIGEWIEGTGELVFGILLILKNGVGIGGAILILGISFAPVLNLGILTIVYKGIAALVQPVADRQLVEVISSVGEGCYLLLKVLFTVTVLFLLTILIAALAGGRR